MKQKIGVPREYLASERTAESEPLQLYDTTRHVHSSTTLLYYLHWFSLPASLTSIT
jgi:hypothetical protein